MATNSVSRPKNSRPQNAEKKRRPYVSGLVVRVLLALIISSLVIMAFFVTVVASH